MGPNLTMTSDPIYPGMCTEGCFSSSDFAEKQAENRANLQAFIINLNRQYHEDLASGILDCSRRCSNIPPLKRANLIRPHSARNLQSDRCHG